MRNLTKTEKLILQEAARIKRRLNEGPGAGVEFRFEDVQCMPVEGDPMKHELWGKLVMRSHGDSSIVVAETQPLGTLDLTGAEDEIHSYILQDLEELAEIDGETLEFQKGMKPLWETLAIDCLSIDNRVYGPGFIRAGFDGGLGVTVDLEIVCDGMNPIAPEERKTSVLASQELEAWVQFHPSVQRMYEELDGPERYSWVDEHGVTHDDGLINELDYTIEI